MLTVPSCYRAEDDDSATIQADGDEDESYLEEYDEEAPENQEQIDPDYTTEQNVEDLSEEQQRQLQASKDERKGEEHERSASHTDDGAESGEYAEEEEIHPPTDEHYEDPEFSQAPLKQEEEEEAEEGEQNDFEAEAGGVTDGLTEKPDELVETIDPDAPLLDAAEQAEEYEETALDYEDGAAAEADAEASERRDAQRERQDGY